MYDYIYEIIYIPLIYKTSQRRIEQTIFLCKQNVNSMGKNRCLHSGDTVVIWAIKWRLIIEFVKIGDH